MNIFNFMFGIFMMLSVIYFGYFKFGGVVPLPYHFLFFGGAIIVIYEGIIKSNSN